MKVMRLRRQVERQRLDARTGEGNGQVLYGGKLDEQLRDLERTRNAEPRDLSRRASGDIEPIEDDRTAVRFEIAGDQVHKCGFAGAVGTDQADFLPGRNVQRQGIGSNDSAEALVESVHGEHWIHDDTSFSLTIAGLTLPRLP